MARTELKLFSGNAHPLLAQEIADFLCVPMGQARLHRFPDTEVSFQIDENIRGLDVFIVQPTCPPVIDHLMELLHHDRRVPPRVGGAITAVIPYYGYARQDRKDKPRVPITAKLVANLIVRRRRQPGADDGPARGADPGVLRHPGGPSVRGAGDHRLPVAAGLWQAHDRLAGRRRRGARPGLRQAAGRRAGIIDKRRSRKPRGRGDARHRRHQGPHLRHAGRHHRHRRHPHEGGRRRCTTRAPSGSSPARCTACCRGRRSTASSVAHRAGSS